MFAQRWRRLLPDPSQVVVLALVVVVVFAASGFIEVAIERSNALANQQVVRARLDAEARERNQRLNDLLVLAQRGENIELRAHQYYSYAFKDEYKYLLEPVYEMAPALEDRTPPSGPPFWNQWLELLAAP